MNRQYDPNPLQGISVKEAIYLSDSSNPAVRQNAYNILSNYQQSFESDRRSREQSELNQKNSLEQQLRNYGKTN